MEYTAGTHPSHFPSTHEVSYLPQSLPQALVQHTSQNSKVETLCVSEHWNYSVQWRCYYTLPTLF